MGYRESGDVCKEEEVGVNHHSLHLPVIRKRRICYREPEWNSRSFTPPPAPFRMTEVRPKQHPLIWPLCAEASTEPRLCA